MKKISQEKEKAIINFYQAGNSMAITGKEFNISAATVKNILERNKIPKRTRGGIYQLPEEKIIQRYCQGESCQSIADSYRVTFHTVSNILEKNNIPRNNRYNNLNLNINYFTEINSFDKAYFLGFLLTDGNVGKDSNAITLSLAEKDIKILKLFSKYTENSNSIYYRKDKPEVTLSIKCREWKQDLKKYGIVPQKTYIADMPILEENMMPHFIRGLIDGDGWISEKSHQLGFCGTEKVVKKLKDFLVKKLGVYDVKVLHPKENVWQVTWASKKDIELIGNYIYDNKQDCFLERKYNNFSRIQGNTELTN